MNKLIMEINDKIGFNIDKDILLRILFEMNRFKDKDFTRCIQEKQKMLNRVFNRNERTLLREYYYLGNSDILVKLNIETFYQVTIIEEEAIIILKSTLEKIAQYKEEQIISSIVEKFKNFQEKNLSNLSNDWLKHYGKKVKKQYEFSLFVMEIDQKDFENNNYSLDYYYKIVRNIYDRLENYRHLIIKIDGCLFDKSDVDVTWKFIYKIGIYLENFIIYKENFFPFKKSNAVKKLSDYIDSEVSMNCGKDISEEFYRGISTGFKFEDCYVSDNQNKIILTYKKIKLDKSPIPCPSCMSTIQGGNSFPELFLRSYECKNPSCKDRSKSGRGKRFDEFGVYRYFKLVQNDSNNEISFDLYKKWRRDIFSEDVDVYEMILYFYAWDNEKVMIYNSKYRKTVLSRRIINFTWKDFDDYYIKTYDDLLIVQMLKKVCLLLNRKTGDDILEKNIEVLNGDSTVGIRQLKAGQIGAVITSPPYYNAREYSQWSNLLLYLIDMLKNASSIFDSMTEDGNYLYNIGDIVNTDNVYVESNMSKKRLQLGFLSCAIFEIVGFDLIGNIIWDKGQVQSKRNSTINLTSGYVKCINCYEHVFVLKKGFNRRGNIISKVVSFSPVIKINSKGENKYKHTAPYPPEMIDLLVPYIKNDKYILDPFLGSGTTLKWCKENNYKGIGYEIDKEYYKLSMNRIFDK